MIDFASRYKLANGKYVVPTPIENCMAGARHLQQVFVYGSDLRDYNICLMCDARAPSDAHDQLACADFAVCSVIV